MEPADDDPISEDQGFHALDRSPTGSSARMVDRPAKRGRDEQLHDSGREERKRSITRNAVSCTECIRRKIKCDRKIPCAACIRRGSPETCSWQEAKIKPEKQTFASFSQVEGMEDRLARVEQALERAGLLPPRSAKVAGAESFHPPRTSRWDQPITSTAASTTLGDRLDVEEAEEAAASLEGKAFSNSQRTYFFLPSARVVHASSSYTNLTSALTSIERTLPMAGNGTATQLLHGRPRGPMADDAFQRLLDLRPSAEVSRFLVEQYFLEIDWLHGVVHRPSFAAEHERFLELAENGPLLNVDPFWLALYYMVLAMALSGLQRLSTSIPPEITAVLPFWREQSSTFYWAAQDLLYLGDYMGNPQVRSITSIILFGQWIQRSSVGGEVDRFVLWLSSAIRIAQVLGLHELGTKHDIMPRDDPSWPAGSNSVKREGALRIWSALIFSDWLSASVRFKVYMISPTQFTTGPPSNVHDDSLSGLTSAITPLPSSEATDASYLIFKHNLATMCRKSFDSLIISTTKAMRNKIEELDEGFRSIESELPSSWSRLRFLVAPAVESHVERLARWMYHLALDGIHSRLVKLHRPFLVRGLNADPNCTASSQKCCESAHILIHAQQYILDVSSNFWFIYNSTLNAAIVLFCALFHFIDTGHIIDHSPNILEIETSVSLAVKVFDRASQIETKALQKVAQNGLQIIQGLQRAANERNQIRQSQALGVVTHQESFAKILVRCTHELDLNEQILPASRPELPPQAYDEGVLAFTPLSEDFDTTTKELFQALGMNDSGNSMYHEEFGLGGNFSWF